MKIYYGLENLRSLESTPLLPIRPITVLVGRNSAGKSTFLRSFSLLRQSLEARSSAPILWYGDYVDFGDYRAAVSYSDTKREITFKFKVDDLETRAADDEYMVSFDDYGYSRFSRTKVVYKSASISVSLAEQMGRTVRRGISLTIPESGVSLEVKFAKDGRLAESYSVNESDISELLPGHSVYFSASNIFSAPALTVQIKADSKPARRVINPMQAFSNRLSEMLRPIVDKRITDENLSHEARRILRRPTLDEPALNELMLQSDTKSFGKLYERWLSNPQNEALQTVQKICSMSSSLVALTRVGEALREFFMTTTYLGPARARSERYYRFQELEVSEISPDGQNLPMFLASLAESDLDEFSAWVDALFGFGVRVQRDVGHISIQLKKRDFSVNVADTGYGVSQMLPVLAQIWWAAKSPSRRRSSTSTSPNRPITMEQPELHLHPAHQSRLADALLRALHGDLGRRGSPPLFIVETHSEALINRLGELIESGDLSAGDVQVVVFSSDELSVEKTRVEVSSFNSDGVLVNWPFGFFNY